MGEKNLGIQYRFEPRSIAVIGASHDRGAIAAASHSGSLAGSDEIFTALMRQCGVLRAESIGFPVALKIVSRDILHKSDAGGVALDLEDRREVIDAYQAIFRNCRAYKSDAVIDGVEVVEMVHPGVETIIGARRDNTFGPILMFGLGGIYVEALKDVAFRALPISRREILSMIKEIRAYPRLLGVRGEEKRDIGRVVETILAVASILEKCDRISDIEINPLRVYEQGQGVKAVDVRILLTTLPKGA